jgi:hypothetical protein
MESRLEQVGKFIKLPLYPRLLLVLDILLKPDDLTLLKNN